MEITLFSHSRWVATAASIWISAATGGSYTFGIYSPSIKSSQSYDQSTLDTISVFKDIGANAGTISGLLYAAVVSSSSHRLSFIGPCLVHLAGAVQCFLGYFLMWLAVVGIMPRSPVPVMCVLMFLGAHGQTFFNTANVVTVVHNFPNYSGTAVGIMKGFLGLSGAMLIQVYEAFFNDKPSMFILMLAFLPTIVSLLLMFLVRICPINEADDMKHLNSFSMGALVIAGYLMIVIILENVFEFPHWAHFVAVVLLILLLSLPFKTAVEAYREEESRLQLPESNPLIYNTNLNEPTKPMDDNNGDYEDAPCGGSLNIVEAMCSANFWLLFIAMACGMGSGLATINNVSQIGESLGYASHRINTLVALWSIWNFLGGFGAGYVSDVLLHQKGLARPLMMSLSLATMTAGHLIIASGFAGNLYIGTVLVGIGYGCQWSLMPTITSDIFGVLHMGTIFNTIAIASPLGTYLLSVWVIGRIYDEEAGDEKFCSGVCCFMTSFIILACVSFTGFLVALTLFFRTRTFYRSVVLPRLHNSFRL